MSFKRNLPVMYAMAVLQGMIFYGPIATLYRKAAGVSVFQISQIEVVSLILCVALEVPWGMLADRIGYKRTLLISCGLYFVSKIVFWRADGYLMFLIERVILAVAVTGISGVDTSILYLSSGEVGARRAFGIYNNCNIIGLLLASGVYALFIGEDYRLAGLLTVFSYGLAAALALLLREVKPDAPARRAPGDFARLLRELLRDWRLLMLLAGVSLLNESQQMVTVFLSQLQYVRAGIAPRAMGVIYLVMTLVGLLGGLSDRLTRRVGQRRFGVVLFALCAAAFAALAASGQAWVSVAGVLVARGSFSLLQPLQMEAQNSRVHTGDRATALSLNALLMNGVAIPVNLALGGAADVRLPLSLGLAAGLCAAGLWLFRRALGGARMPDALYAEPEHLL